MSTLVNKTMLASTAVLAIGLAGCSGSKSEEATKSGDAKAAPQAEASAGKETAPAGAASGPVNLSQGPGVCFDAVAKLLGKDAKVNEITSFFSAGSDIDSDDKEPAGQMTTCTVDYQDPADPRKLLSARMDAATGVWSEPNPVEISVSGNAADFKLDDYLIPLSAVNPANLTGIMEAQKARISGLMSKYAWTGVRLSAPGAFSDKHTLRLDLTGRLTSNDIKHDGYASVSTDGTKITADHLMP